MRSNRPAGLPPSRKDSGRSAGDSAASAEPARNARKRSIAFVERGFVRLNGFDQVLIEVNGFGVLMLADAGRPLEISDKKADWLGYMMRAERLLPIETAFVRAVSYYGGAFVTSTREVQSRGKETAEDFWQSVWDGSRGGRWEAEASEDCKREAGSHCDEALQAG